VASVTGVPLSKSTRISGIIWRGKGGSLQAVGDEFKNGFDLLPRHAEFFYEFVNAHVLKILEYR